MTKSRYSLQAILGLAALDVGIGMATALPYWATVVTLAFVNIGIILIVNSILDVIDR